MCRAFRRIRQWRVADPAGRERRAAYWAGCEISSFAPRRDALRALEEIRVDRIARNEREWTLDEINAEISASRSDRRKRLDAGANA